MMTKTKSQRTALLKYAAILPILLLLVFSISAKNDLVELKDHFLTTTVNPHDTIPPVGSTISGDSDIFQVVEEMPRFPGCEDQAEDTRTACAQNRMLMHIYTNIKYPQAARAAGVQGVVVASFVVEKDGSLSNFDINRSVSTECDEEVLRVVKSLPKFIPGKQGGKTVRVQYVLPVKYKLEGAASKTNKKTAESTKLKLSSLDKATLIIVDGKEVTSVDHINVDDILSVEVLKGEAAMQKFGDKAKDGVVLIKTMKEKINVVGYGSEKKETTAYKPALDNGEEVFQVVEKMPMFPGTSDMDSSKRKLLEFVYNNIKYPKAAKDAALEGMAVVKFIITKEGKIIKPHMVRTLGGGTDEEVLRVMQLMQELPEDWTPGYQRGRAVNVAFNLPIKFKLTDDQPAKAKAGSAEVTTREQSSKLEASDAIVSANIYPNPSSGTINAEVILKNNKPATLLITDINGKQIHKQTFKEQHIQIADLELKNAANGILLLSFLQDDKVIFIKEVSLQR